MAKALTLEQTARAVLWFALATALLFFGPRWAGRLVFDAGATATMRYLGIALSVLSLVPWLGYVAWGLSIADEARRRTLVAGTALAFALAILYSAAVQLVADARLGDVPLAIDLRIAFLLWAAGIGLAALIGLGRRRS
jgi:hypothetical protein